MQAHPAWSPIRGVHGTASPARNACKPSWGTGAACSCQSSHFPLCAALVSTRGMSAAHQQPLALRAKIRECRCRFAQACQQGPPTADDTARDGDVILAAQARTLGATDVVLATTNV